VPEVKAREAKLIQYLSEAHLKERQLEQALEAHIAMTDMANYRKRLQQHLTETKRHARAVERRIKQLGGAEGLSGVVQGAAGRVQEAAARGAALAQGQVHMLRGTSEQEKMLKNAKTEFQSEAEEIGTYTSIEALAKLVGDRETEQLAKSILREEKRMAGFLERLIPRLTQAVGRKEIPASQRNGGRRRTTRRRSTSGRSAAGSRTSARSGASRSRSTSSRGTASRSGSRRTTARSGTARRTSARSGSRRTTSARSGGTRRTTSARGGTRRTTSARSGSSRARSGASTRGTARRTTSSGARSK
jgi:ferritin-like metal-binding protein YciE